MLTAQITQHPVGQGGFCTGWLRSDTGRTLRWGYDCGSVQTKALTREIGRLSDDLDIFFVSHLHEDHVSGIDRLLGRVSITEVVLPWLNMRDRLLLAVMAMAEGGAPQTYFEFVADPAAFLLARGVTRVTWVHGPDDPDFPEGGEAPDLFPGREEGGFAVKWTGRVTSEPRSVGEVTHVSEDAVARVAEGGLLADWILKPFVHPPGTARMDAFRSYLDSVWPGLSDEDLAREVLTSAGRDQLRSAYHRIWVNHNLVSLSVYAGPDEQSGADWSAEVSGSGYFMRRNESLGWLSTGDSALRGIGRRTAFKNHYGLFLPELAVLQAPHHGSRHNWDDDLLQGIPRDAVVYAAAGQNPWGHPHREVRDAVRGNGFPWEKVGSRSRTQLTAVFRQRP